LTLTTRPIIILWLALLSACSSTHPSKIVYESNSVQLEQVEPTISGVIVSDVRGTDNHWLDVIRGGYGNVLKRLETEKPTDQIIDDMYTLALRDSALYDPQGAGPYSLSVAKNKFDCSYYFNLEAHAHVTVTLSDLERGLITEQEYAFKRESTLSEI